MDLWKELAQFAIGVAMFGCLGAVIGGCVQNRSWERDAVKNGAAKWWTDEKGDVHWRWLSREERTIRVISGGLGQELRDD